MRNEAHGWTVAVILAFSMPFSVAHAQAPSHAQHKSQAPQLPIVTNGAERPESIPDELAYAHFIMAIATPDTPSPQETWLRGAVLAPIQLSKEDFVALVSALAGVHAQLRFLDGEVQRLSAEPALAEARLTDLRLSRTRTLSEAHVRLTTRLSPAGLARLDKYIRTEVKPRIVLYGDSPQE